MHDFNKNNVCRSGVLNVLYSQNNLHLMTETISTIKWKTMHWIEVCCIHINCLKRTKWNQCVRITGWFLFQITSSMRTNQLTELTKATTLAGYPISSAWIHYRNITTIPRWICYDILISVSPNTLPIKDVYK